MRSNTGFSLMEMMVVIAILAIFSAFAVPNLIGWLPKYRLGSAASDMLSVIRDARLRAVKEFATVVVEFDPATETYIVFLDNGANGGVADDGDRQTGEPTLKSGQMPPGIDMDQVNIDNSKLRFDSRGLLRRGHLGGNIQLKNGRGDRKRLVVNFSGSVRIETS